MQFNKKYAAVAIATILSGVSVSAQANQGYDVVEVGAIPTAFSSVGTDLNDSGDIIGYGYDILNLPIRVELLDPESDVFNGIDDLSNLDGPQYRYVRNYLNSSGATLNNPRVQKLRLAEGFFYDSNFVSFNDAFDVIEPNTGTLTYSNSIYPQAIDTVGNSVGVTQTPFVQEEGVDAEGETHEYFTPSRIQSAYWTNGTDIIYLTGHDDVTHQGVSKAFGMNDAGAVVGFAAVSDRGAVVNGYEDCIATEGENSDGEPIPKEVIPLNACMYRLWAAAEYNGARRIPLYNEEAYVWEVDASGNVLSQRALGVSYELPEESNGYVRSEAVDINNNGIAVGITNLAEGPAFFTFADVYTAEGAVSIFPSDMAGYSQSRAVAINDDGVITGFANVNTGSSTRARLFVTHVDDAGIGEEIEFPDGFFRDSSWFPSDINNNNQIVGRAEVDQTQVTQRRQSGFVYNLDTDELLDLNNVLPCDSGYRIIDATAINDQGEILAVALTQDEKTVNERDFSGNSVQMLVLVPNENATGCETNDDSDERQGAFISPVQLGFFALLNIFAVITRRKKLKVK